MLPKSIDLTDFSASEFSNIQSMRNLVCHRSMTGKTCLPLVEILGLHITMTGNFCENFALCLLMRQVKFSQDRSYFRNYPSRVSCGM